MHRYSPPPLAPCTCPGGPFGPRPRCHGCALNEERMHGHVAEHRGERWIERIVWHRPELVREPWRDTDKARAIASRRVDDLVPIDDPEAHALLLERLLVGARRRWAQLQDPPALADLLRCRDPRKLS